MATGQPSSSVGPVLPLANMSDFSILTHLKSIELNNNHQNSILSSTSLPTDQSEDKRDQYANNVKGKNVKEQSSIAPIPIKKVCYNNGVPRVVWTEDELDRMNIIENLQYAVVGKFSYGWTKIEELRTLIPKQCKIKGKCKIGLLRNRHILIRFSLQEDFINMMSKTSYYFLAKDDYSYMMRPLIYDANFTIEEETTQAMVWISFPDLKPTFFVKESIF